MNIENETMIQAHANMFKKLFEPDKPTCPKCVPCPFCQARCYVNERTCGMFIDFRHYRDVHPSIQFKSHENYYTWLSKLISGEGTGWVSCIKSDVSLPVICNDRFKGIRWNPSEQ